MKNSPGRQSALLIFFALAIALFPTLYAANADAQQPQQPAEAQQAPPNQDPLLSLELSPEQRQQIRLALEATKADRTAANQRLRRAQVAYDEALDADNPSEEVIEQRAREVGEAQAALMRARAGLEIRIRRILTPGQRARLRELRLAQKEAQRVRRQEQRVVNQGNPVSNPAHRNLPPNQRNGMSDNPILRRNSIPRKPPGRFANRE